MRWGRNRIAKSRQPMAVEREATHRFACSVVAFCIALLCGGCGSTLCMVSKKHLERFQAGAEPVYVTNPQMGREYQILKASGIYQLSDRPQSARRLTLRPIHQYGRCGNPLMLSAITLGIIPGVLPAARTFEYDLDNGTGVESYVHHLPLYERFSIWEWLVRRDEQKVVSEALAWSSRQRRPDPEGGAKARRPLGSDRRGCAER